MIVYKGDSFEIEAHLKHIHGYVSNLDELKFNTSVEGSFHYIIKLEDEFGNFVKKLFTLNVINSKKESSTSDIISEKDKEKITV